MYSKVSKIANIGLAITMILGVSANNAQALDFTFSDFTADTESANGVFRVSDSATSGTITASDFEDWEINITGTNNVVLYGPGGNFGTQNSTFFSGFNNLASLDLDSNSITFFSDWAILDTLDGTTAGFTAAIGQNGTSSSVINRFIEGSSVASENTTIGLSATSAAVPFEFSPTLGLLMIGGIFTGSRFLKKRKNLYL